MRAFRSEASDLLQMMEGIQEQRVRWQQFLLTFGRVANASRLSPRAQYLWDLDEGLDRKLSPEDVVQRSASRVGLFVPETYTEDPEQRRKEAQEKEARAREAAAKYLDAKRTKEAKDAAKQEA
jgi:hypothetical protein